MRPFRLALALLATLGTALLGACGTRAPEEAAAVAAESTLSRGEPPPAPAAAPALPDFTTPEWTRVTSRAGTYLVCWRSEPRTIPRNADFELDVWVLRDGAPVADAILTVSGFMPEHGHGLLRAPRAERQEDGSYRVTGMLLHMRGHWQLLFEVLEGSLAETAECALEV
jgi:hypothetical protein